MGHIKLAKASGQFDIVSADNVGHVKEMTGTIEIGYTSGYKVTISGGSIYTSTDVFTVVKALDIMEGASGVAPLVELSSKVSGTTVSDIV